MIQTDSRFGRTDFADGRKAGYARRCTRSRMPKPVTAGEAQTLPKKATMELRGKLYSCAHNEKNQIGFYRVPLANGDRLPCCVSDKKKPVSKKQSKKMRRSRK